MSEWKPIETAPIEPFDAKRWYMTASPYVLVWCGHYVRIASYGYTRRGKGRWQDYHGNIAPTHWMPLPEAPAASDV